MEDANEKINQFKGVTGTNDERARFYLESASWNVEIALASFFDGDAEPESTSDVEVIEDAAVEMKKAKVKAKSNAKFATIHTLNKSSDEDEEEGQAFYAGGSETSGQQVLGPKKRDYVRDIFKSVKEHGEILDDAAGSSKPAAFKGAGYKLGQTSEDSECVPGASAPTTPSRVTLKLWRQGFSIDNGPLRLYSDATNEEFLTSVRRGEIPQELRKGFNEVHVRMEDHRMDQFPQGERRSRSVFQGTGHTLGSPVPSITTASLPEVTTAKETQPEDCTLQVDASQPTTNLQIRLADGSRLVTTFNHSHTIQSVYDYITSERPEYQSQSFILMTAYPSKKLDDYGQTLVDAGLLNSAIIQKLV